MSEYESPEWHPAFEEYCETIYELGEDDLDVIQARIAERMEVSRPAVSEMVKRLEAEGLIESGRKITLTENCLLYTSPSPRDKRQSRMPSSA